MYHRFFRATITLVGLIVMFQFSACAINGSFGGLTSQFKRNYPEKAGLYQYLDSNQDVCSLAEDDKVFIVNDRNVQLCLSSHANVILYKWSPFCTSGFCYPLSVINARCIERGMLFLPLSEYYDNELMEANLNQGFPLLAPDIAYYNTNFTDRYLSRFYAKLNVEDHTKGRFAYFKDGKFVRAFDDIRVMDSL